MWEEMGSSGKGGGNENAVVGAVGFESTLKRSFNTMQASG
jgi:hypothetical protein